MARFNSGFQPTGGCGMSMKSQLDFWEIDELLLGQFSHFSAGLETGRYFKRFTKMLANLKFAMIT
jgi:hypothetical protein